VRVNHFFIFCERHYPMLLALVFCGALGLRIGTAAAFEGLASAPSFSAQPDQLDYENLAARLASGEGYTLESGEPTAHRPPGTSLSLLPAYMVFGRSFAAGRIWFCLLSAMTCLAVASLGTAAFGRVVGLVAAAWLAAYPGHFYYPLHFVSEVPFALYVACGAAASCRAVDQERRAGMWASIAGVFWALAFLTRPQIVLLLPLVVVLVPFISRRAPNTVRPIVVHVLVCGAVIAPWIARNAIVMGRPTLSTVGGYTFWGAHNDRVLSDPALRGMWVRTSDLVDAAHPLSGSELERETEAWRYGCDFVKRHVAAMPALVAMKLVRFASPFEATPNRAVFWAFALGWIATAPFILIGAWRVFRQDPSTALVLLLPLVATMLSVVMFYGSIRFRDASAPLLTVLAARGLIDYGSRQRMCARPISAPSSAEMNASRASIVGCNSELGS